MSRELAAALFLGLCLAEAALWLHTAINRAVSWLCPCDAAHP